MSAREILGNDIYEFLASCLNEKGMGIASEKLKEEMILDLAERLQAWLMQHLAGRLTESQVKDLDSLSEKGADRREIMEYLSAKIPNLEVAFAEEMEKFKKTYLEA